MMKTRPNIWRWVLLFAALGLVAPVILTVQYLVFGRSFGDSSYLLWVWPSSIMFMALDSPEPAPTSTVVVIYCFAFLENCALYATVGVFLWPIASFLLRRRKKQDKTSELAE
jgi:hypothetical protein